MMNDLREPNPVHARELAELEALTEHSELAAAAALDYCAEEKIRPPAWVLRRAATLMSKLLKRDRAEKAGRSVGKVAGYRRDQRDVERWDAVEEMRRIRSKVKSELKLSKSLKLDCEESPRTRNCKRLAAWFSRYDIFECASMYLTGRDARVSPIAMKASHRRCLRRSSGSQRPDRYYAFDERFLVKLGFPRLQDRRPGTKWLPLYDLTC
jgi:hypothetical protein